MEGVSLGASIRLHSTPKIENVNFDFHGAASSRGISQTRL